MEEVKRLRQQAEKAKRFASQDPTASNKQRFTEMAASYEKEADDREQMLSSNPAIPNSNGDRNKGSD